jgi:hypothetical protein
MRRLVGCFVLFVFVSVAGCEPSAAQLHEVKGTITFDGKVVSGAQVQFVPDGRSGDPASAISGDDGTYLVRVPAGAYTVRILAQKSVPAPPGAKGPSGAPITTMTVDVIPERYNAKSELQRTITAPAQLDFDLKP